MKETNVMKRPITIFTGQWADLPFEEGAKLLSGLGYEGLEIATWADFDVRKAAEDAEYVAGKKAVLKKYDLQCYALGSHLTGQCVGDLWDPRLDGFAPSELAGKPEEIRAWAIEEMEYTARAAAAMGCGIVTGFMGSPIWKFWYSFPQTSEEMVEAGFDEIVERWSPILDVFDEAGVKFALEVHPTEIAFDYYSAKKLLEKFDYRKTLGFNFDPSHLLWQGVKPELFLRDFSDRIYHVHMKDVKINLDGRTGVLGSHITFGDTRRGWNFVSMGHGDVDFNAVIRELNQMGYEGPLSIEWEDSGMDRVFGARESYEYTTKINFNKSDIAFDSALAND